MQVHALIIIPILVSALAFANQCRLRPFHLQDQIYGSCPDFAGLSPKNESNYAIAAGPFPCGSCVRVSYQTRQLYLIVVDSTSSPGLDLHLDPMVKLSRSADPSMLIQGLIGCQADVVPLEMCNPDTGRTQGGDIAGQTAIGGQRQIPQQPWMNPGPGLGQINAQNAFKAQQQFQPNSQFGVGGGWQQQQQQQAKPVQQQQQASPMQQMQQQPSWQFPNGQDSQQMNRMQQMPPNAPMFLRRKTQIRVYD